MPSMLSAIRAAVQPLRATIDDLSEGAMPGADASIPETQTREDGMSDALNKSGATMTSAELAAALAAATTAGRAEGLEEGKASANRLVTILAADGVKGDAKRTSAAVDLATTSPEMSAEAVIAFVTANVTASAPAGDPTPPAPDAAAYEASRLAAAGLAQPEKAGANADDKVGRILGNYAAVTGHDKKRA